MSDDDDVRAFLEQLSGGRGPSLFHDPFLSLDPRAVRVLGRAELEAGLPARGALFADAGVKGLRLGDVSTRRLDGRHVLADATWRSAPGSTRAVELASTYLLRSEGEAWSVVVYLNHQDLPAVLAEQP